METENETAPFHVPQELTFEYLNYLYWAFSIDLQPQTSV